MKQLTKREQKNIQGGNSPAQCAMECRVFLQYCPGVIAKSDCPDFMACLDGCNNP